MTSELVETKKFLYLIFYLWNVCIKKNWVEKKWNFFLFFYLNLTFFPSPDNLCFYSEKILFNLWNQVIVFLFCKKNVYLCHLV